MVGVYEQARRHGYSHQRATVAVFDGEVFCDDCMIDMARGLLPVEDRA